VTVLLVLLLGSCGYIYSQNNLPPENKIEAVFLYNFTRFVEWPPEAFSSADAPLVIGIIGNDPFGEYINEAVTGESVASHPVVVKRFQDARQLNCHILYISSSDPEYIKWVLSYAEDKSILTVSDQNNFARWGGIVQFMKQEDKIKLQINVKAAQEAKLVISSKLLGLAKIYE
jgi:hypothetical protein